MSGTPRIKPKTVVRHDSGAHRRVSASNSPPAYHGACLECGEPFAALAAHAEFCAPACRARFNTRRTQRGAQLYDLYMPHRFDRPLAQTLRCLFHMNRLAAHWRDQDKAERAGRRSWAPTRRVITSLAWLRVDRLVYRKRPR